MKPCPNAILCINCLLRETLFPSTDREFSLPEEMVLIILKLWRLRRNALRIYRPYRHSCNRIQALGILDQFCRRIRTHFAILGHATRVWTT